MTDVYFLDNTGSFRALPVTRTTEKRIYFIWRGKQRSVSRAELERRGMAMSRAVPNHVVHSPESVRFIEDAHRGIRERARGATSARDEPLRALGLSIGATVDDVKRAFRERAKSAHPDAGGTDAAFIELLRNYERAMRAVVVTQEHQGELVRRMGKERGL